MKGPELLETYAGTLKTRMGACFPGSGAYFRGHNLHTELSGISWFELYLFGITGRRLPAAHLKLLQAIWSYTSYPDARIWNNRVAALAGSVRSTGSLGLSGASAVSEASIYGHNILIRAGTFLLATEQRLNSGDSLEECVLEELRTYRSIAGYGRPVTSKDERISPILNRANEAGLTNGARLALAFQIDDFLVKDRWRLRINYAAVAAALALDAGLTAEELYLFVYPAFLAGMPPCYTEAREKTIGTTFPTPCSGVSYDGMGKRAWNSRQCSHPPRFRET